MKRESVESDTIASAGYDEAVKVLEIEFRRGTVYRYFSVPKTVFDGLMAADSKGRYFHKYIRDVFRCEKLTTW